MSDLWLAVRWLHVLAMAFFVGGPLLLAVVPVERRSPDRERLRAVAPPSGTDLGGHCGASRPSR